MYSVNRKKYQASVLIAAAAGLLGAALAQHEPGSCECLMTGATPVYELREVEVVATRLPP